MALTRQIGRSSVYAQLSDTTDQVPVNTDPFQVTFNTQDAINLITQSGGDITIDIPGTYQILVGAQIGRAVGLASPTLDLWLKKNNVDVPRSAVRNGITSLDDTSVLVLNVILPQLEVGDVVEVWAAVSTTTGSMGLYATEPANAPVVPSVILSMFKI